MLILASASPRRQELLRLITKDFEIFAADIDERVDKNLSPEKTVESLALKKAEAVWKLRQDGVIIGADTVVETDGDILGKPADKRGAAEMLRRLSGKTHRAVTGVCILSGNFREVFSKSTEVSFIELSEQEIAEYVETGEPLDKAGAYGIQGKGALLVSGIIGDYYNVMGLPVTELNRRLKTHRFI